MATKRHTHSEHKVEAGQSGMLNLIARNLYIQRFPQTTAIHAEPLSEDSQASVAKPKKHQAPDSK